MRRFLVSGLLLITALGLAPVALGASQTQTGCTYPTGGDTRMAAWRENILNDTSDGNDVYKACVSVPYFSSIDHAPSGGCNGPWWFENTWDDCLDSVVIYIAPGTTNDYRLCVYSGANYTGTVLLNAFITTGAEDYNFSSRDSASSARWRHYLYSC